MRRAASKGTPSSERGFSPLAQGAAALLLALPAFALWRAARNTPPAGVSGLEAEERAAIQLKALEDVLAARNDNDPRLDRDFNELSPEARSLFRAKYQELAPELRNKRGTIVYLLGKAPTSTEDWDFLAAVAAEPPCLSLADCSKKAKTAAEAGDEVTLAYPALVALSQARRVLERAGGGQGDAVLGARPFSSRAGGGGGPDREQALRVLAAAKTSQAPAVVRAVSDVNKLNLP